MREFTTIFVLPCKGNNNIHVLIDNYIVFFSQPGAVESWLLESDNEEEKISGFKILLAKVP